MPSSPKLSPSPSSAPNKAALSSAESSLSTSPRVPSPLNPSATPVKAPVSLPELDDSLVDFPEPPGRSRGAVVSTQKKPLLKSSPGPVVKVTSSPASTVAALPPHENHSLFSIFSPRTRSGSPSGRIDDNVWRKKVNELNTPPSTGAGQQPDTSPSASWWGEPNTNAKSWEEAPKKKRNMSQEEEKAWTHTRERVSVAIKSILGTTLEVAHEILSIGGDFLELAPVPGLSAAARALLEIWDALENVDLNAMLCLRLTERCAETLISVEQEVHEAGVSVTQELQVPLNKLQESFNSVRRVLIKEANRPFIKRYLKRDEILREIAACDADVRDALDMFSVSVSIRILKQTQEAEKRRQAETQALLAAVLSQNQQLDAGNALMLSGMTQDVTLSPPQITTETPMSADQLRAAIASLQLVQNTADSGRDTENLQQLMRQALQSTRDADVLDILQIKRQDMPEAIKTLQRALERVIEREREPESPTVGAKAPPLLKNSTRNDKSVGQQRYGTLDSTSSSAGSVGTADKKDTLEREFLESGIEALVRMSRGVDTNLPSWTITKYEVDREKKIGIGFFSDVYKGTWRGRTVAIKVLADTTPRELFRREVAIWKTLRHPNVLELYGASSTAGDPPWFFVSPYEKNGSLNEFLRRIQTQARSSGSSYGSGKSPHHSGGSLPSVGGPARVERQATFPIWPGVNSYQLVQPRGVSPARDPEYRRSRDLHRFMCEIAKGMEYLHSQNVHHGDLKAANVLVDDNLRCVISDFGQSEMKSEAFSLSGASPPHGTLRWQAPELMRGTSHLTKEMDVYSYGICCVEILTWGNLPWAHTDDFNIRRLVLDENERPPLPIGSKYVNPALQDLIGNCWDQDPQKRPSFSHIVPRMKSIRKAAGDLDDIGSPRIAELPEPEDEFPARPSPDIRPLPLPNEDPSCTHCHSCFDFIRSLDLQP
ncbi:Dual specificity protein kinase splB [Leucoagaricus sp. SymC.cos]|nr:Dual specificity protein kinase splB [Leucoagaricus sp. SymC.cos]